MEDFIVKAISQIPLVGVITWIWWTGRRDALTEMRRLQERVRVKDAQLQEAFKTYDKLSDTLLIIKDRLR